jgi:hypothetical protein
MSILLSGLVVTQDWSQCRLVKKSWDWTAHQVFTVTGTPDPGAAIELAVPFNSAHPDNGLMTAGERYAEQTGPLSFKVHALYSFGDHGQCQSTPLNEPEEILWEPDREVLETDVDSTPATATPAGPYPIVNSAGDPFSPSPQRVIPTATLVVRRWEPLYNVSTALNYQDHVNIAPFSISGAGGVEAGQAYCDYYKPIQFYTLQAPFVKVEYRFRLRPGTNPWQYNVTDKGRNGWYTDPATSNVLTGPFVHPTGEPAEDILLNGSGVPIYAGVINPATQVITTPGYLVRGDYDFMYTPQQTPMAQMPSGLTKNTQLSTAKIVVLTWTMVPSVDFSALNL